MRRKHAEYNTKKINIKLEAADIAEREMATF